MGYEVTVEGSGGRRRYCIDGEKVDRFSDISDAVIGTGFGLDRWKAANTIQRLRLMPLADAATLPPYTAVARLPRLPGLTASEVGTTAHTAAETGQFDTEQYHPDARWAVAAAGRFFEEEVPEIIESETPVGSKRWGYAGTPDARAIVRGELSLIDYKAAKNIYPRYHVQLAAYELASVEMGKEPTARQYLVWLKPNGTYELVPVTATADDWLAAIAWYRSLQAVEARHGAVAA